MFGASPQPDYFDSRHRYEPIPESKNYDATATDENGADQSVASQLIAAFGQAESHTIASVHVSGSGSASASGAAARSDSKSDDHKQLASGGAAKSAGGGGGGGGASSKEPVIDVEEFTQIVSSAKWNLGKADIKYLLSTHDVTGDGKVAYRSFIPTIIQLLDAHRARMDAQVAMAKTNEWAYQKAIDRLKSIPATAIVLREEFEHSLPALDKDESGRLSAAALTAFLQSLSRSGAGGAAAGGLVLSESEISAVLNLLTPDPTSTCVVRCTSLVTSLTHLLLM